MFLFEHNYSVRESIENSKIFTQKQEHYRNLLFSTHGIMDTKEHKRHSPALTPIKILFVRQPSTRV